MPKSKRKRRGKTAWKSQKSFKAGPKIGSSCEWSTLMRVETQLAAIRYSSLWQNRREEQGRKTLGLTNDALLLLLANKTIPSSPAQLVQMAKLSARLSLSLTVTFARSRSHVLLSFSFLFAFRAGHLDAPDLIINCALHSIYLPCSFSTVPDPHLLYAAYACF